MVMRIMVITVFMMIIVIMLIMVMRTIMMSGRRPSCPFAANEFTASLSFPFDLLFHIKPCTCFVSHPNCHDL